MSQVDAHLFAPKMIATPQMYAVPSPPFVYTPNVEQYNTSPTNFENDGEPKKKRKRYSKKACVHCKRAHSGCNDERPCKRCKEKGLTCYDAEDHQQMPIQAPPVQKKGTKRPRSEDSNPHHSLLLQQQQQPFVSALQQQFMQQQFQHLYQQQFAMAQQQQQQQQTVVSTPSLQQQDDDLDNFLNLDALNDLSDNNTTSTRPTSALFDSDDDDALLFAALPDVSETPSLAQLPQHSATFAANQLSAHHHDTAGMLSPFQEQGMAQIFENLLRISNGKDTSAINAHLLMAMDQMGKQMEAKQRQLEMMANENARLRSMLAIHHNPKQTHPGKAPEQVIMPAVQPPPPQQQALPALVVANNNSPIFWATTQQLSTRAVSYWDKQTLTLIGCNSLFCEMTEYSMEELKHQFSLYNFFPKKSIAQMCTTFLSALVNSKAKSVKMTLAWATKHYHKFFVKAVLHLEESWFWLETEKTDTCDDEFFIDGMHFPKTYEWKLKQEGPPCNPTDTPCGTVAQQARNKFEKIMQVLKTYDPLLVHTL